MGLMIIFSPIPRGPTHPWSGTMIQPLDFQVLDPDHWPTWILDAMSKAGVIFEVEDPAVDPWGRVILEAIYYQPEGGSLNDTHSRKLTWRAPK